MIRAWLWVGIGSAVLLAAAGCSGGSTPYPVHGIVYLDGEPAKELAGGTVTFNSPELHKSASGQIQADGSYRLGSTKKDDGAIPGKYQVSVSPPENPSRGERGRATAAATPVSFEEPKDMVSVEKTTNDIPIQLKRKIKAGR